MHFEIGKGGIACIDFTVSLDRNSTRVSMTSVEDAQEFYAERYRISNIFGSVYASSNDVEFSHGSYSEQTITQLKRSVAFLNERSLIDMQRHDEIIKRLEEMVAQVKKENVQETAQFAPLLNDFKTNVEHPYRDFNSDDSLYKINYLISEVCRYRGNPMKVGSCWVYLLLCEGALDQLSKSLHPQEHYTAKESLMTLRLGVTSFLQQYETELHAVIEKTITKNARWFQQLYSNYKSMVETGQSPKVDGDGPIMNINLNTLRLFLPDRFTKSKL